MASTLLSTSQACGTTTMIKRIQNISRLAERDYDLFMLASSGQTRSTAVCNYVDNISAEHCAVLKDPDDDRSTSQPSHSSSLIIKGDCVVIETPRDDDTIIYSYLNNKYANQGSQRLHFLVDYTCMAKMWYNSFFNWFLYSCQSDRVDIDFIYAMGKYEGQFSPLTINEIMSLPGCEGSPVEDRKSLAAFALGYDGSVATSVRERLEPDDTLTFIASPGSTESAEKRAATANENFLGADVSEHKTVNLHNNINIINSVYEEIGPYLGSYNVSLVPLGPKPLTLSFILLSRTFQNEVRCLSINGSRDKPDDVKSTGEFNTSRITLTKQ